MGIVGNDNLKANYTASNRNKAGGWFSGHMAQIMVFLNGLILTFTAFATLNIFIEQIIDEGATNAVTEIQESVLDKVSNLKKGIQTAAARVYFSDKLEVSDITYNFKDNFAFDDAFDYMFWLKEEGDHYTAHDLIGHDDKRVKIVISPERLSTLHRDVVKSINKSVDNFQLIQPSFLVQEKNSSPVIMVRRVALANGEQDIVYGIVRIGSIIDDLFERRKNIHSLSILLDDKIALWNRVRDTSHLKGIEAYSKKENIALYNHELTLKMGIAPTEREVFLKKIPLLMFLFGITLTLIGTLYVRNNQKQSMRLAVMNAELAQKNAKLNSEVLEREKLNHALRKQERENRALIDSVSDIIFETDTEGNILFLNETWQKITGFPLERSIGRNLFDLLNVSDQAEQKSNMAQLVKGRKHAYRAFTRLRNVEGTFRSIELAVSMLRQDENKEMRVVGTITDVEERRRAERALSETEKKYRAIVENAASGIYQVTLDGVYLSANPALAKILGYDSPEEIQKEVRNANTDIYYSPSDRERSLRDAVRSGSVNIECQVRCRDGKIIWVQESLRAVKDEKEQLVFFEGSIEDITQRKSAEIALRGAMVQSDLASRAKSEFLANMSHELRTPLNAIIGFSDIIKTESFGAVGPTEYLDYARDINESGKRLLQVINDILDVSRIETGDRQLNEGVVDLHKIVGASIDMLASRIEAQKMLLSNYVNDRTPTLIGEAQAVKQMVINLVSNAIKFTPEGGRVSVHANVDDYGQMHVSVTDTGIGLSDEEIEKALSPFGQVNGSMNKSTSGAGLGLTLVKSLMTLHGGTVEIFSQKGIGTTVSLIFPAKRVAQTNI